MNNATADCMRNSVGAPDRIEFVHQCTYMEFGRVDADTHIAIGSRPDEHDLTGLAGHRLRSHGGLSEQPVPFMVSRPLNATYRAISKNRRLRNFDIFDFALNGTV